MIEPKFVLSPYVLVPQNEAEKGAVVQISVPNMEYIPQELCDVAGQLPEDTLGFSIAIGFPTLAKEPFVSLQLKGGKLSDGCLSWSTAKKFFLPTSAMKQLRVLLDSRYCLLHINKSGSEGVASL